MENTKYRIDSQEFWNFWRLKRKRYSRKKFLCELNIRCIIFSTFVNIVFLCWQNSYNISFAIVRFRTQYVCVHPTCKRLNVAHTNEHPKNHAKSIVAKIHHYFYVSTLIITYLVSFRFLSKLKKFSKHAARKAKTNFLRLQRRFAVVLLENFLLQWR